MNSSKCACNENGISEHFRSPADYINLTKWISQNKNFHGTPVLRPYDSVGSKKKWYSCEKCHQVWRLVDPDPPFTGVWERVLAP